MSFYSIMQSFIQTLFLIVIIKEYINRNNINFTDAFISTSYNIIYLYSKCQILFIKLNKRVSAFIESNAILSDISNNIYSSLSETENKNTIEFIKNGEVIKTIKCGGFNCDELISAYEDDFDFLIYSHLNEANCANKVISQKGEEINVKYELSNVSFILVEFQIDDTIFKINLKNEKYNFYVKGNKLSFEFFMYYLKNICFEKQIYLTSENDVSLHIIDQDVNAFELDLNDGIQSITIEKESYSINKKEKPTCLIYPALNNAMEKEDPRLLEK